MRRRGRRERRDRCRAWRSFGACLNFIHFLLLYVRRRVEREADAEYSCFRGARFAGFLLSCLAISLAANRGRGIRSGAALLGVGVV